MIIFAAHCGVEQMVARRAHNPKAVGSSPTPATKKDLVKAGSYSFLGVPLRRATGQAIRYKSSLRSGLSASILHAAAHRQVIRRTKWISYKPEITNDATPPGSISNEGAISNCCDPSGVWPTPILNSL